MALESYLGNLSLDTLAKAKHATDLVPVERYDELIMLVSDERYLSCPRERWQPYEGFLLEALVDRSNQRDLLALYVTLTAKQHELRRISIEEAKKRLEAIDALPFWSKLQ